MQHLLAYSICYWLYKQTVTNIHITIYNGKNPKFVELEKEALYLAKPAPWKTSLAIFT